MFLKNDYFGNKNVTNYVSRTIDHGTESYKQLDVYGKHGFVGLQKYLIDCNNW